MFPLLWIKIIKIKYQFTKKPALVTSFLALLPRFSDLFWNVLLQFSVAIATIHAHHSNDKILSNSYLDVCLREVNYYVQNQEILGVRHTMHSQLFQNVVNFTSVHLLHILSEKLPKNPPCGQPNIALQKLIPGSFLELRNLRKFKLLPANQHFSLTFFKSWKHWNPFDVLCSKDI